MVQQKIKKEDLNILHNTSGHLSSIEQKELSVFQRAIRSTAFWILVIIVILVAIFGALTPNNVFFETGNLVHSWP